MEVWDRRGAAGAGGATLAGDGVRRRRGIGGGASVEELEEAAGADARGRVRVGVVGGPVDDGGGRRRVAVEVVWGRTRVLIGRWMSVRVAS